MFIDKYNSINEGEWNDDLKYALVIELWIMDDINL